MKCDYWAPVEDATGGEPGDLTVEATDPDEVKVSIGPVVDGDSADGYISALKAIEFGQQLIAAGTQALVDQVVKVQAAKS